MMTARVFAQPALFPAGLALFSAVAITSLLGCNDQPAARNPASTNAVVAQPISQLTMALDAMQQLNAPNSQEAGSRAVFYLNQWLSEQDLPPDWSPDPTLKTLPSTLQLAVERAQLERLSFDPSDLIYLQQNQWLGEVAERIRREPAPEHLQPWLKRVGRSASPHAAEQLAAVERLFDWTIRNTQLDELPPTPKGPTASVGGDPTANTPPLRGEVGPGYGHLPWQILLHGHGDKLERSRLFLLLARQIGVQGGILAVADPQSAGVSNPWCCGMLIGDEICLFDAELGLPIPAADGEGIATLAQVAENPKLLRQLNLEDGPQYPIEEDDLQRVVALIDAEPLALSRRMEVLQTGIPNSRRMVVSIKPSEIQTRFRKHEQIGQISLWRVPFEAPLYQIGLQQWLAQDPAALREWHRENAMFNGQHPLLRARDLHFQGQFADDGARSLYLSIRPSEKAIDRLGTSTRMREEFGLDASLPDDPAQRSEMLENIVNITRRAKQHATYWLGLSYYEEGNYEVARQWLGERTLDASPRSPWAAGARYNLARTHENLGEYDKAIELYRADNSPQRHGNLLRARWLEQLQSAPETVDEGKS